MVELFKIGANFRGAFIGGAFLQHDQNFMCCFLQIQRESFQEWRAGTTGTIATGNAGHQSKFNHLLIRMAGFNQNIVCLKFASAK